MNSATMMPVHDHEQWFPSLVPWAYQPGEHREMVGVSLYQHDERCPGACGPCGGEGGSGAGTCLYCHGDGRCRGCNAYMQWEGKFRLMMQDSYREVA